MIVRSCLLESKSTKRCFVREYAFQLQKADLSWLWDKWKVWKMTILFCVSHHHTLNSKSNVFIEFLFPRLLGSRHVSIKVLVFWFSWKLVKIGSYKSFEKFRNSMNTFDLEFKVWWWETQNKIVIFQTFHLCHNYDRSTFWSWKAYSRTKHRLVDLDSNRQLRTIIPPLCKFGQSEPWTFLLGAKKYSKSSFLGI